VAVSIDQKPNPPHADWIRDMDSGEWLIEVPPDARDAVRRLQSDSFAAGRRVGAQDAELAIMRRYEPALEANDTERLEQLKSAARILRECFPDLQKPTSE
jgi:hypothetical protein